MATVKEVRERKKKLQKQIGEPAVAEIEKIEEQEHEKRELSKEEVNRMLALGGGTRRGREEALKEIARREQPEEINVETGEAIKFLQEEAEKSADLGEETGKQFEENRRARIEGEKTIREKIEGKAGFLPEMVKEDLFQLTKKIEAGFPEERQTAAQIIEVVRSPFSKAKALDIATAEQGFNTAKTKIDSDLQLLREGRKTSAEVRGNIVFARESIHALERSLKGFGQLKIDYNIDQGNQIRKEIIIFQQILAEAEEEVELARRQALINLTTVRRTPR